MTPVLINFLTCLVNFNFLTLLTLLSPSLSLLCCCLTTHLVLQLWPIPKSLTSSATSMWMPRA